jgi:hypothetical protein
MRRRERLAGELLLMFIGLLCHAGSSPAQEPAILSDLPQESAPAAPPTVVINEFVAANTIMVADEFGEFEDWLEIYNYGEEPVDLGGMFLSDDPTNPFRWRIPGTLIVEPKRFALIWCDGSPEQGSLHASFALQREGEEILLTTRDGGTRVDHVVFPEQERDVSEGRIPDGTGAFTVLVAPSPMGPNTGLWDRAPLAGIQVR